MLFVIIISNRCPPYIKRITTLTYNGPKSTLKLREYKKIFPGFFLPHRNFKNHKMIYNLNYYSKHMKIDFDDYEKDLIIETIQYRLENDKKLIISDGVREDLKDILRIMEGEEDY